MSLEDNLIINSEFNPKPTLEILLKGIIESQVYIMERNPLNPIATTSGSGWTAYAGALREPRRSFIKDQLGIESTIDINFRLDKFGDVLSIEKELITATIQLVRQTQWDIAFIHGDSHVVLLHKSGRLILQKNHPFWASKRLDAVDLPYEFDEIPAL